MTDKKEQFKECIELMQRDVAEFEAKYQGRFAEGPHVGLGSLGSQPGPVLLYICFLSHNQYVVCDVCGACSEP